ncbi:HBR451Wp [Eremothecium sinecaudum]|uniref:Glucose starvation modulator protein 1 n=1 Tax=Eremothecium sinecaudum TaxID=45286 RepID=A0A120K1G3_9SACH|nr:HBR451Wp [Eremothecium sinecaudum]AMD19352.1 HBR451Wp [Eremothecium sinecaudum]
MTKRIPVEEKMNRKPISRACRFCHIKHLQCDVGRPCQNCVKRNFGDSCRDNVRKPRKVNSKARDSFAVCKSRSHDTYSTTETVKLESLARAQSEGLIQEPILTNISNISNLSSEPEGHKKVLSPRETPLYEADLTQLDNCWAMSDYAKLNEILGMSCSSDEDLGSAKSPGEFNKITGPIEIPQPVKPSDLLEDHGDGKKLDSGSHLTSEMTPLSIAPSQQSTSNDLKPPSLGCLSPYTFRKIIKTPEDLYNYQENIVPHDYRQAYRELLDLLRLRFLENEHEDSKLGQKKLQMIAYSIKQYYTPIFVTLSSNLVESDLRMQEIALQRSLLEYEDMAKMLNSVPICIWRRSGELCYVSNGFTSLTGFSQKEMLSRRRFIVEYFDDDSIVEYFRIFNEHLAFSTKETPRTISGGQSVFSNCNLVLPNGSYMKCACIWTIKRDTFNLPMLITGQFLPILDDQS